MERKFASKLNQLKPAAQARKQASTTVKETIQLVGIFLILNFTHKKTHTWI
jgi:hypothetical protein